MGLALGTGSEVFFTTVVEKAGHRIDEYEVVPVEAPEMVAAIERGDIDAYAAWEPWVSRGVQAVKGTHTMLTSEGLWEPSNSICGNKQWAAANPDRPRRCSGSWPTPRRRCRRTRTGPRASSAR